MTAQTALARGVRPWVAFCVLLAFAALVLPPFLVKLPPVLDYPNHLARLWLIAGGVEQAPLNAMYAVDWSRASTNVGVDVLAAVFAPLIGVDVFGPLLLAAAIVLPPLGALALNRTLFGGVHWWWIAFALLAWNLTLLAGFLNFHIGVGLALLAAAADPALARRGLLRASVARAAFAAVLLTCHPFAFLFYGALLGGLALGSDLRELRARPALTAAVARAAVAGAAALFPLLLFVLFAPAVPGQEAAAGPLLQWDRMTPGGRIGVLLSGVRTYGAALDLPVLVALAAALGVAALQRRLSIHGGLLFTAIALGVLAAAMPEKIADTWWMDRRLPLMAALTFLAALRPEIALAGRPALTAAAAFLALASFRTGTVAGIWTERQADVRAVSRVLAYVPAGATVLPVDHTPSAEVAKRGTPQGRFFLGRASYWHYPTLAVSERRAFVPTLFTAAGKQPLRVLPPYDDMAVAEAPLYSIHYLAADGSALRPPGFLHRWRERYDFVLVVNADIPDEQGPPPALPELELVEDAGFARLYRVRRPA